MRAWLAGVVAAVVAGAGVARGAPLEVFVDTPAEGLVTSAAAVTISGHVTGGVAPMSVSGSVTFGTPPATHAGATLPVVNGTFSATPNVAEGPQTFNLVVTDAAGATASASVSITVDRTPPFITVLSPSTNPATATSALVTVSGTVGDTNLAELRVAGAVVPVVAGTFVTQVPLSAGRTDVVLDAVDAAGNRSTYVQHFDAANLPPSVVILTPSQGYDSPDALVTVSARVNATTPLASVEFGAGTVLPDATGLYTAQVPLGFGDTTLLVRATDTLGQQGVAQVLVHYRDAASAPLAVTGVFPANGATDVEPDERISVAFNKPIVAAGLDTSFTVKAGGAVLPGTYYVVPGNQTVSFGATAPLPEGQTLQIEVSNVTAATGLGLAAPFRSEVTVRRPHTVLHGVVLDDGARPLANIRVAAEGTAFETATDVDGNWHLFLPGAGTSTVRFEGGTARTGQSLPTVRRRLFASGETTTHDVPLFLTPTDEASTQRVDGTADAVWTFANRVAGLSLAVPRGAFAFADGTTAGAVTLTEVSVAHRPVPLKERGGPTHLWQLQPSGTRLLAPVSLTLANPDGAPAGRHALLYAYDGASHQVVRAGLGRVSADGASIIALEPFAPASLEFLGVRTLTDAEDTAVVQGLAQQGLLPDGGARLAPTQAPPSLFRRLLDGLADSVVGRAFGQSFWDALIPAVGFLDNLITASVPGVVSGRVRSPAQLDLSLAVSSPAAVGGLGSTGLCPLTQQGAALLLPLAAQASWGGDGAEAVTLALTVTRADGTAVSPPAGAPWTSTGAGFTQLSSALEVQPGVYVLTFNAATLLQARLVKLEVTVPGSQPDAGPPLATVKRLDDTSGDALDSLVRYRNARVSVTGPISASGLTGPTGEYGVPFLSLTEAGDAIACASIPGGVRALPRPNPATGKLAYARVQDTHEACTPPITVQPGRLSRADIIVDARWLYGNLTFVDRKGNVIPRADCTGPARAWGDTEVTSVSPEDLAATEVHFFREDNLEVPFAMYAPSRTATCDDTAQAFYTRLWIGTREVQKVATRARCAALAPLVGGAMSPGDLAFYEATCRRAAVQLKPGDGLVLFAVNHRTGHAGMRRLVVPSVNQSTTDGGACAADVPGQPLPFIEENGQHIPLSRCLQQDIGISGNLTLYPAELDVRVSRRRAEDGVTRQGAPTLVRSGGAATTADSLFAVSTHWRVRMDFPDGGPSYVGWNESPDAGLPECRGGVLPDGGPCNRVCEADGGNCRYGESLVDYLVRGQPLEVPCGELPPGAPDAAFAVCVNKSDTAVLVDVPSGVPPIAGQLARWTGSALETPAVTTFAVPPGRKTSIVNGAMQLTSPDGGVTTLAALPTSNYYLHIVGYPIAPRDANGDGTLLGTELTAQAPDFDTDGGPLPTNAVPLKTVYTSVEPGVVRVQRFDLARETEFRLIDLNVPFPTGVLAIAAPPDGGVDVRTLQTPDAGATPDDLAYTFFASLQEPESPTRSGPTSSEYVLRLGSDNYGVECQLVQDAATHTLRGECDGEALEDVLDAADVLYLELYLRGNADNVLYRTNFYGTSKGRQFVASGSEYTAAQSVKSDTPAAREPGRPILKPPRAIVAVQPAQFQGASLATAQICLSAACGVGEVVKAMSLTLGPDKIHAKSLTGTPSDAVPVLAERTVAADGTCRFSVNVSSGFIGKPLFLVVDPTALNAQRVVQPLGKPGTDFDLLNIHAWGQSRVGGVNIANGNLAFTHVDLSVPYLGEDFSFARSYNNQDNSITPMGVGWRHNFFSYVLEEEVGRYSVHLGGQAYDFPSCAVSGGACAGDGTHGHTLQRYIDATSNLEAYVFATVSGARYVFRRPSVGRMLDDEDGKATLPVRLWLLDAFTDGHAADLTDWVNGAFTDDTWTTLTYRADTNLLDYVTRVTPAGAVQSIKLGFEYEPLGNMPNAVLSAARNEGMQRLKEVKLTVGGTLLKHIVLQHDDAFNLTEAGEKVGPETQRWAYAYRPRAPRLADSNEVEAARLYQMPPANPAHTQNVLPPLPAPQDFLQYEAKWERRTSELPDYGHTRATEVITDITLPGQSGVATNIKYTPQHRKLTAPDGVVTDVTLSEYGSPNVITTGSRSITANWTTQKSTGGQVKPGPMTDSTSLSLETELTSKFQVSAVTLRQPLSNGLAVTGVTAGTAILSYTAFDARYGTATTAVAKSGVRTPSAPNQTAQDVTTSVAVSSTGDVTGVVATDSFGTTSLFSGTAPPDLGRRTEWTDAMGRTVKVTAFTPDLGLPGTVTYSLPATSTLVLTHTYSYDLLGRLTQDSVAETGEETIWSYDALGRVLSRTRRGVPDEKYTYRYTLSANQLIIETECDDPSRIAERHSLTKTTVLDGLVRSNSWRWGDGAPDGMGGVAPAAMASETLTWVNGRLTQKVDGRGFTHQYGYEGLTGQLTSDTVAGEGLAFSMTPDAMGRALDETGPLGERIIYRYDQLGRPVRLDFGNGAPGHDLEAQETYVDGAGNPIRAAEGDRLFYFDVDGLGRLRGKKSSDGTVSETRTVDAAGRPTQEVDSVYGTTASYTYADTLGRLTSLTVIVPTLSSSGAAGGETRLDESHTYTHDATARTWEDSISRVVTAPGVSSRTEEEKRKYDVLGRLLSVSTTVSMQTPADQTTSYTYDAQGHLTVIEMPTDDGLGSLSRTFEYDAHGSLVRFVNEAGFLATYAPNAFGQREKQAGPRPDMRESWTYDGLSRVKEHAVETGSGNAPTTYAYAGGGVIHETDAELNETTTTINGRGDWQSRFVALSSASYFVERFLNGSLVQKRTEVEGTWQHETTWHYDDRGRVKSELESGTGLSPAYESSIAWVGRHATVNWTNFGAGATAPVSSWDEDGLGREVGWRSGTSGYQSIAILDVLGHLRLSREPSAQVASYGYGKDGRLTSRVFGTDTTSYAYTARGLLRQLDTPDGRRTSSTWDVRGLLGSVATTRPGGVTSQTTGYHYDVGGLLDSRTEGAGSADARTWTMAPGPRGELLGVTLPGATSGWTYGYDKLLRLTGVTPPGAGPAQSFGYDALGRQKQRTRGGSTWATSWADGKATETSPAPAGGGTATTRTSTFDGRGRLTRLDFAPSSLDTLNDVSSYGFAYDAWDGVLSASEVAASTGTTRAATVRSYDDAHLLQSVGRAGLYVTYSRDVDGQLHTETSAGGTVTSTYDASTRRLSSLSGPWGTTDVAWEAGGQRLASLTDGTLTECWRYDDVGRLSGLDSARGSTPCNSSGPWLTSRSYVYDGRGNRISETDGATRYFRYDDADRLVGWTEWDGTAGALSLLPDGRKDVEKRFPAGARTAAPYFSDFGEVAHFSFGYDGQGAMTSRLDTFLGQPNLLFAVDGEGRVRSRTTGSSTVSYDWNADSRLVQAAGVTYEYDAAGMRRQATSGTGVRRWAYGGESGEEASSEVPQGASAQALGRIGGLLFAQGTNRFAHDGLGSVIQQVPPTGGAAQRFDYSAWGAYADLTPGPGTASASASFGGMSYDAAGGRLYANQRWYDSDVGQWLSMDPVFGDLKNPNSLGPWAYANLNPTRFTDPDGRCVFDDGPCPASPAHAWVMLLNELHGDAPNGPTPPTPLMIRQGTAPEGFVQVPSLNFSIYEYDDIEYIRQHSGGAAVFVRGAVDRVGAGTANLVAYNMGYDANGKPLDPNQVLADMRAQNEGIPPVLLAKAVAGMFGSAGVNIAGTLSAGVNGDMYGVGQYAPFAALDTSMLLGGGLGLSRGLVESGAAGDLALPVSRQTLNPLNWSLDVKWFGEAEAGAARLNATIPIPKRVRIRYSGPRINLLGRTAAEQGGSAVFHRYNSPDFAPTGRHVTVEVFGSGGHSLGEFHQWGRNGLIEAVDPELVTGVPRSSSAPFPLQAPERAAAFGEEGFEAGRWRPGSNDCVTGACAVANQGMPAGGQIAPATVRRALGME